MSEPDFAEPTLKDFDDPTYREAVETHRFYDGGVKRRVVGNPDGEWEVWDGTPATFDWDACDYRIVGPLRTQKNKTGEPQPSDPDSAAGRYLRDDEGLVLTASAGARGPDQQRIADEVIRWGALLLRKNADYGSSAWKTPVLQPHCDVGTAILVRMSDKIERIQSLLKNGGANVNDESLEDTIRDLGCYALLYLARPTDDEPIDMDTL